MVMQEYFDCGVFEVSLLFMVCGLAAMVVYSTVGLLSKHLRDSTLQLVGYLIFTAAHVWLFVVVPLSEQGVFHRAGKIANCCHFHNTIFSGCFPR